MSVNVYSQLDMNGDIKYFYLDLFSHRVTTGCFPVTVLYIEISNVISLF